MKQVHFAVALAGLLAVVFLAGPLGCGRDEDGWVGDPNQPGFGDQDEHVDVDPVQPVQPVEPVEPVVPVDPGPGTPPVAGQVVTVASGSDPDVAVDSKGHLHFAYERGGYTWYMEYDYARGTILVPETPVGGGDDPQIAVDSHDQAHVAFGNVFYSYWTGGGFSAPVSLVSGKGKPRIAVDSLDRIYVVGCRDSTPRNKLFVFENGTRIIDGIYVGGNDIGGIDIDSGNRFHTCWRSGRELYYTSYLLGEDTEGIVDRSIIISGAASDFSDIAVDHRDGSLHIAHTHSFAGGIDYLSRNSAGAWGSDINYAADECLDAADFIQPTIAVDRNGNKYIVFTGDQYIPKYFVVGRDGSTAVGVTDIDSVLESGGKKQNPNVASRADISGAYVTWGMGTVYVRSLGN